MVNYLFIVIFLLAALRSHTQGKVGINTANPQAMLHVKDSSVLFSGSTTLPANEGNTPASGQGIRMMWYPGKAAFRAGYVLSTNWDKDSIGDYSIATGFGTKAKGSISTAFGNQSMADGNNSLAGGTFTLASGFSSTALGHSTKASGQYSTAIGRLSEASGLGSTAIGDDATASGTTSTAMGYNTTASGHFSTAFGYRNTSLAYGSLTIGRYNDSIVVSNQASWINSDPLFIVGNGSAINARSNALVVSKDARVYIDPQNINGGDLADNALLFGSYNNTGEGVSSKRTSGGNQYGLDFYTAGNNRLSITNSGAVQAANNLTVQNGKGIIRNIDGTQLKKLSASVTVNASFNGGETKTFPVAWPENFSAAPEAYVGNVTGGSGGWAEVVMTVSGTSTTGATLYVYNPKTTAVTPNFTIKVIAIGAQ